jgi:hypothetical protein
MTGSLPDSPTERGRKTASAAIGDLSSATVDQLATLYDACESAVAVWLGAVNQPRSCYEGDDEHVVDIMDQEMDRLFYIQELVVAELRGRAPEAIHDPCRRRQDRVVRARVLMDWFCKDDDDDELYVEIANAVPLLQPEVFGNRH